MPLMEMANLLNSFRLMVCPGLVSLKYTALYINLNGHFSCNVYKIKISSAMIFRIQIRIIWLPARHSIQKAQGPCYAW